MEHDQMEQDAIQHGHTQRDDLKHIQQIERLIREIEASADPATKAGVRKLVEAILEFHGAALSRMLELSGDGLARTFARDDLAASLLLLYGLHPEEFETRVQRAVDRLQGVDLLSISGFVVRVKGDAPRPVIEQALYAAAPEIAEEEIEGARAAVPSFVPLEALLGR